MPYIHRYLEDAILHAQRTFKVLFLGGPRQVGKTTLLLHLAKSLRVRYVSLDELAARELAARDPELFLEQHPPPVFIDEVQYAPELFPVIKHRVDQSSRKGQYWLTGSQQFTMLRRIQETLAGRVAILQLLGFSLGELRRVPRGKASFLPLSAAYGKQPVALHTMFRHIFRGSFPALWQRPAPARELFFSSYIQTYLDRDLRDLFGVEKLSAFHTFLQLCAARTGQLLNYSDLARDAGVSVHAARQWISILEQMSLVYLLRPYFKNRAKRLIKSPKLYFLDTGFAAYLTRWNSQETLQSGAMAGALFETFVLGELIKSYLFRGQEAPLYYFRDKEGREIDCLIESGDQIYPVEIKLRVRIVAEDFRSIRYLRAHLPNIGRGTIITAGPKRYAFDRDHEVLPAWMLS